MNNVLKFKWQEIIFYLPITDDILNTYAINSGIVGYKHTETFMVKLAYYNLSRDLYRKLKTVFRHIQLVDINANDKLTNLATKYIDVELPLDTIQVEIYSTADKLDKLLLHYHARALKIPRIFETIDVDQISFAYESHEFQLVINEEMRAEDHTPQYVKTELLIANDAQYIFVEKSILPYLYKLYYENDTQQQRFEMSHKYIEQLMALVNMMLAQLKDSNKIEVSRYSICKLPQNNYIRLIFKHNNFTGDILIDPNQTSLIQWLQAQFIKCDVAKDSGADKQADQSLGTVSVTFPVVSNHFYVTPEQLDALKVGDILIGLEKVSQQPSLVIEVDNATSLHVSRYSDGKELLIK